MCLKPMNICLCCFLLTNVNLSSVLLVFCVPHFAVAFLSIHLILYPNNYILYLILFLSFINRFFLFFSFSASSSLLFVLLSIIGVSSELLSGLKMSKTSPSPSSFFRSLFSSSSSSFSPSLLPHRGLISFLFPILLLYLLSSSSSSQSSSSLSLFTPVSCSSSSSSSASASSILTCSLCTSLNFVWRQTQTNTSIITTQTDANTNETSTFTMINIEYQSICLVNMSASDEANSSSSSSSSSNTSFTYYFTDSSCDYTFDSPSSSSTQSTTPLSSSMTGAHTSQISLCQSSSSTCTKCIAAPYNATTDAIYNNNTNTNSSNDNSSSPFSSSLPNIVLPHNSHSSCMWCTPVIAHTPINEAPFCMSSYAISNLFLPISSTGTNTIFELNGTLVYCSLNTPNRTNVNDVCSTAGSSKNTIFA